MKYEKYRVRVSDSFRRYDFISEGPKGRIAKQVVFEPLSWNPLEYNLAFGDLTEDGQIDDLVVTHNRDTKKVLVTVASTVRTFLDAHPGKLVFIKGSTDARTRLYRIAITKNYHVVQSEFYILGFFKGAWRPFKPGTTYEAFIVTLKKY